MATLHFDGASDGVIGTNPGAMNGAFTLAALFSRADTGASTPLFFHGSAGVTSDNIVFATFGDQASIYIPPAFSPKTGWFSGTGSWWIVAVSHATGTAVPRFHYKNITAGSAWQHADGTAPVSDPASSAGGGVRIGMYRTGGGADDLNGDVALIGYWDGTALNDSQAETLSALLKTSDWHALAPSSLTQLNTLTPTDLEGRVTWSLSGPVLTGPDPPGWTFDGVGGTPPTNSVAPVLSGAPVNGQTLTCSTGTWAGTPTGYTYQWKRNDVAISGATASTYTLVSADKGTSVKCTVTATNATGSASTDSNTVSVSSTLDALPTVGDVLIRTSTGWTTLT